MVSTRAGFDTRYLQVSRYFDSSIPIFCGFRYFPASNVGSSVLRYVGTSILPGFELRFFGTSVLRYFDISPDLDLSLNSDSIPF